MHMQRLRGWQSEKSSSPSTEHHIYSRPHALNKKAQAHAEAAWLATRNKFN